MAQQGTKALQRELRELEIQLQRLGGDVSQVIPQGFNAATENATSLRRVISDLKEELREITEGSGFLNSFSTHIKNILKDQTKLTNAFEAGRNVIKSMTANAQELAKSAQGYKKLSSDQLETKMKEQQELMRIAKLAQQEFKYKRNLTDEEKEIYKALKQSQKAHESITAELEKQLEIAKKQEGVAKLAGKGIDAMSKIPLVGKMMDTKKAMEAVNKSAEEGKGVFESFGAGVSAAFKSIDASTVILLIIDAAIQALKFIKDLMFAASEQTANIRKTFAVGREEAEIMRERAQAVVNLNRDYLATSAEILSAQDAINKMIGGQYDLIHNIGGPGATLVRQYAQARDILKLSEKALEGITKASLQTGKEFRDIQKQIVGTAAIQAKQLGIQVNYREVMEQVGSASEKVKGDFGGTLESLTKGVVTLTKFGMTLENISNIQQGLLDFETSFANELKAELLSGQEINLDRARYLAMTRQTEELSKEINALGFTKAKLDKMNTFELEAQAKMLNMQSDELYNMVTRRENLTKLTQLARNEGKKLTDKELESETLMLQALKAQGVQRETLIAQVGEQALANMEAQSASERFERALTALKDKLASMVESGLVDRLIKVLEDAVRFIGKWTGSTEEFAQETGAKALTDTSISEEQRAKILEAQEIVENDGPIKGMLKSWVQTGLENSLTGLVFEAFGGDNAGTAKAAADWLFGTSDEETDAALKVLGNYNAGMTEIKAEDFTIKTHPKDTLVMAGGTRLGEEATNSQQQQPVLHAVLQLSDGSVIAKGVFDYAKINNHNM